MTDTPVTKKKKPSVVRTVVTLAITVAVVYFGNVEVQSYLGRKAVAATGLEPVSLEQALVQARADDRLVLADMSAIWCPSCRRLDKKIFGNPAVQQAIRAKYVFSRIEYESDEGEAFMETYGVRGFPTLLILDAQGNLIRELPVTFDPEQFVANL